MEEKIEKLLKDMESLQRIEKRQIEDIGKRMKDIQNRNKEKSDLIENMLKAFDGNDEEYIELKAELKNNSGDELDKLKKAKNDLKTNKKNVQARKGIEELKQEVLEELQEKSKSLYNRRETKQIENLESEQGKLEQEIESTNKRIENNEKLINREERRDEQAKIKLQEENDEILAKISLAKAILVEVNGIEQEQAKLQADIEKLKKHLEKADENGYGVPYIRELQSELDEKKSKFESNKETMKAKKKQLFAREDGKIEIYIGVQERRYAKNLEKIENPVVNQKIERLKEKSITLNTQHENVVKRYGDVSGRLKILKDNVHMQETRYKQIAAIASIIGEVKKLDIDRKINFDKVRETISSNLLLANYGKELSYPEEKLEEEKPAQEKPTQENPAQEKPTQQKPAQEKPTQQKPAQQNPTQEQSMNEQYEIHNIRIGKKMEIEVYNKETRMATTRIIPAKEIRANLELDYIGKKTLISNIIGADVHNLSEDKFAKIDPNIVYGLQYCIDKGIISRDNAKAKLDMYINEGKITSVEYKKYNRIFRKEADNEFDRYADIAKEENIKVEEAKPSIISKLEGARQAILSKFLNKKNKKEIGTVKQEKQEPSFSEKMADKEATEKTNKVSANYQENSQENISEREEEVL